MSQAFAQARLMQCARAYAKALEELRTLDAKLDPDLKPNPMDHDLKVLRREVHETEYDLLEAARLFHKTQ